MEYLAQRAAAARREGVAQRLDRPKQRRNSPNGGSAAIRAHMTARADDNPDGTVHFRGVASAYEQGYEMWDMFGQYTEVVSAGAGSKSLARADLDVPLVLGHDQMRRIARTTNGSLTLRETDAGLEVDAPSLDMADQDVAYIVPKLRAGLIDEMSFAFMITRGRWSPDYSEFRIEEFDIHRGDVAIVGFGANPATSAGVRMRDLVPAHERAVVAHRWWGK